MAHASGGHETSTASPWGFFRTSEYPRAFFQSSRARAWAFVSMSPAGDNPSASIARSLKWRVSSFPEYLGSAISTPNNTTDPGHVGLNAARRAKRGDHTRVTGL